ncbi:ABC transporter permease [Streptomyces solisilvae]|uniref:ABC transporter permease n=1 Tax=Streptomyces autolyticus TaxID=75293 RepID=A0ABM6HQD1_9ACTN|nr:MULTISPECIES: ABC transporter permease [Streptomyces]AQA16519.1 ABC transporter permease [Streptomyces autolyticus]MCC4318338.1 ABC transporter permease [Streptomyces malaysiensis]MCQ6251225.1 ABC transporter permease [Streptomyces malaysiensis]WPB96244.1 ABC transporter permease [Streptomyces malaysiensis]
MSRLRLLTRNKLALTGAVAAAVLVLIAVFAPLIAPYDPARPDFAAALQEPGSAHWLGTDDLGRDQLSRVVYGVRASLQIGLLAVALAFAAGVPLGLIAGYYGRFADSVISRLTDTLLAFPFLVLAVGLATILGPSLLNATIAVGVSQIPAVIRITRAETLRLKHLDYVAAAVANGGGDGTVLFRHILPGALSALTVQATVGIPTAIIGEALLSFLGLGVQPPSPSLGVMLSSAQAYIAAAPWMAVFPGLAIIAATLAFNLLGDGLRDILDPQGDSR